MADPSTVPPATDSVVQRLPALLQRARVACESAHDFTTAARVEQLEWKVLLTLVARNPEGGPQRVGATNSLVYNSHPQLRGAIEEKVKALVNASGGLAQPGPLVTLVEAIDGLGAAVTRPTATIANPLWPLNAECWELRGTLLHVVTAAIGYQLRGCKNTAEAQPALDALELLASARFPDAASAACTVISSEYLSRVAASNADHTLSWPVQALKRVIWATPQTVATATTVVALLAASGRPAAEFPALGLQSAAPVEGGRSAGGLGKASD